MRKIAPLSSVVLGLYALTAHGADPAFYPPSTADQIVKTANGHTIRSKFYASGDRIRTENQAAEGKTMTGIFDRSARKMWIVMPPPMGCIEQPLRQDPKNPMLDPAKIKEEPIGDDTVAGHPTKKYKLTTTIDGKPHEQYVWRATDLKGFPIRSAAVDGSYESTFENVTLGAPDAKLFQPPSNCKTMPDFGSMMGKPPGK
jgi:hypothetical protein